MRATHVAFVQHSPLPPQTPADTRPDTHHDRATCISPYSYIAEHVLFSDERFSFAFLHGHPFTGFDLYKSHGGAGSGAQR